MIAMMQSMLSLPLSGMRQVGQWSKHASAGVAGHNPLDYVSALVIQMGPMLADLASGARDPQQVTAWMKDFAARAGGAFPLIFDPRSPQFALQELRNKVEVFLLVMEAANLLHIPKEGPLPLPDLVQNAYGLGPYQALWAVEGLGHEYGDRYFKMGIEPREILSEASWPNLPHASLLMLHAGIGLSFAKQTLAHSNSATTDAQLTQQILEIIRLCRANVRPGYLGPSLESLGLVVRTFNPDLFARVDPILRTHAPEVRPYYWHGVGRALYFLVGNWLPCSDPFLFQQGLEVSNDELSALNVYAGLSWAFLMVNQPSPEALDHLLIRPFHERIGWNAGFVNGIASSAMMRFDTTPDAPFISSFGAYCPEGSAAAREPWEALMGRPYRYALTQLYPAIRRENRLGDLFAVRDLERLSHGHSQDGYGL